MSFSIFGKIAHFNFSHFLYIFSYIKHMLSICLISSTYSEKRLKKIKNKFLFKSFVQPLKGYFLKHWSEGEQLNLNPFGNKFFYWSSLTKKSFLHILIIHRLSFNSESFGKYRAWIRTRLWWIKIKQMSKKLCCKCTFKAKHPRQETDGYCTYSIVKR